MNQKGKRRLGIQILQTLLFLGVGLLILYLVYRQQDAAYQAQCQLDGIAQADCNLLEKVWIDFKSVKFLWLGLVIIAFLLSNVSRTMRWQMLIKPLGYKISFCNGFFSIMIGYFANLALPRMGEIVKIGTLSKYEKIPFEKVTGTIVVDRAMDLICLGLMFCIALLVDYDVLWGQISAAIADREMQNLSFWLWGLAIFAVIILLFIFLLRKQIMQSKPYAFLKEKIIGFIEGIKSIGKLDSPILFIAHSLFIWLMFYLMMYLAFFAFEPVSHLGPTAGLMVFIMGSLGMVIPSPGGMGTFHFLTILGLSLYGISAADGFSFANIVFFSVQILSSVVMGTIGLIVMPLINKRPALDIETR